MQCIFWNHTEIRYRQRIYVELIKPKIQYLKLNILMLEHNELCSEVYPNFRFELFFDPPLFLFSLVALEELPCF